MITLQKTIMERMLLPIALVLIGIVALAATCAPPTEELAKPTTTPVAEAERADGAVLPTCAPPDVFNTSLWECASPSTVEGRPVIPKPIGDAACDDDASPGYTWQGSQADGYTCVPLAEFSGRTGHIATANGRVNYHTAPCHDHDTALPPPFADVTLCVETGAWNAAR